MNEFTMNLIERQHTEEVLGFDPTQVEEGSFIIDITPEQAKYILRYHNNDNRKLCPNQVNKIADSVKVNGWVFDGNPIVFNTEGNQTEGQHRLVYISDQNPSTTYRIVIVLGAATDSFTNTAIGKPRRPHDEIWRKDNTALPSQTAILGDLLVRSKSPKLSMGNAVKNWYDWKDDILKGEKICNKFLTNTPDFSTQTKTIGAWATLCVNRKMGDIADQFLDLLEEELLGDSTCRLTADFVEYWKDNTWNESNEKKLTIMYYLLCVATDKMLKQPTGKIALDVTPSKLNHRSMGGIYKKFLS